MYIFLSYFILSLGLCTLLFDIASIIVILTFKCTPTKGRRTRGGQTEATSVLKIARLSGLRLYTR